MKKVIAITLIIIIISYLSPWVCLWLGLWLGETPQKPQITYGEFTIEINYKIEKEDKVIRDTIICEYSGIGVNEASGKYIKWTTRLLSGNSKLTLYSNSEEEVYYQIPPAKYLMGDTEKNYEFSDEIRYEKYDRNLGFKYDGVLSTEELYNRFGITVISVNLQNPLKY